MSSIEERIKAIENRLGDSPENRFHQLADGEYDHTRPLLDNLRGVQLPPGAVPPDAPPELNN